MKKNITTIYKGDYKYYLVDGAYYAECISINGSCSLVKPTDFDYTTIVSYFQKG